MKVEVGVLGSPSLVVFIVSVDVKQHLKKKGTSNVLGRQRVVLVLSAKLGVFPKRGVFLYVSLCLESLTLYRGFCSPLEVVKQQGLRALHPASSSCGVCVWFWLTGR